MKMPLLLDGAMGTELQNRGIDIPLPIWSANANLEYSDMIIEIHKDYIKAGVDIITTNTFRTTSWTYRKLGLSNNQAKNKSRMSLYKAVECAQIAVSNRIKIAGAITTIEDCYIPRDFPGISVAEDIYGQTLEWLYDAGVDIILFETMGNINEISCALKMSNQYNIPIWFSLITKDKYHILDGSHIKDVFQLLNQYSVNCLLTNCNRFDLALDVSDQIRFEWEGRWGAYPNLAISDYENHYFNIIDNSNFRGFVDSLLLKRPDVIGLCCGSTPGHIKKINHLLAK